MRNLKVKTFKSLLAAFLFAFVLCSAFFAGQERFHECHDDDCPICFLVHAAEQNLSLLSFALALLAVQSQFAKALFKTRPKPQTSAFNRKSLVSQKIRINI